MTKVRIDFRGDRIRGVIRNTRSTPVICAFQERAEAIKWIFLLISCFNSPFFYGFLI